MHSLNDGVMMKECFQVRNRKIDVQIVEILKLYQKNFIRKVRLVLTGSGRLMQFV